MQTQQRQLGVRLLCVNCNICIDKLRHHLVLELDTRVISKICEWNSSIIITEEDYVCDACQQLALQHVNSGLPNEPGASSSRDHKHVCILCGSSLRTRKRDAVVRENPSQLQQAIHVELENRIASRQATSTDHVCHPCWLRLKRVATRNMQQTELEREPQPQPQEPQSPPNTEQQDDEIPRVISLPQYRRAANTAAHCVFSGCQKTDLHRISDPLRATTLSKHKYHLPINARICVEHTFSTDWDMLFNSQNSLRTFTAEQVEHALSFINAFNTFLDFSNMESVEELMSICFIIDSESINNNLNFYYMLNTLTPHVVETNRGILGLGALLMKMRTGEH